MRRFIVHGNLTGRYQDGVFQKNIESNAFYKKIMTIINMKVVPNELNGLVIDLTPIDLISDAVFRLIFRSQNDQIVYHLYNSNTITIEQFVQMLNEIGFNIKTIEQNKIGLLSKEEQKQIGELMLELYPSINKTNITVINKSTDEVLRKLDFKWKKVDRQYLLKIINYVREVMRFSDEDNK